MADTLVKKPVVIVGTKAQVESTTMGENDFAIATDVEFYNKEEVNGLLGEYATKTDLNKKQNKLSATGSSNRPVYYDGNALKETTRLKAELVSGGFVKEVYYAHHPEMGEMHIIPFIYNDFAFIDKKGGSYTVTRNDGGEITNPQNIFDAAPSFMLSRGFTADTIWTVEISTPTSFGYGTILYIDFGSEGFGCAYIKIEAQNSATGAWQNVLEKTDNALPYVYCRCSSNDAGVNKFRFTFKSPIGTNQFRISSIGAISYKSSGVEETLLTLKGGTVYGDVIAPNITKIQNTLDGKVNIAQGAENAGKILKVDDNGNVVVGEGGGASLPILMSMWSDHAINDMSWLRADTFSWHSGDVYIAAYNHLASDINNGKLYAWNNGVETIYTRKLSVVAQDNVYDSTGEKIAYVRYTGDGYIAYDNAPENYFYRAESSDITGIAPEQNTDTIGDITIQYYESEDGHKICLPDQESNLVALYESTGVAWYYILDTANKQFKLPRTKWGFTGLRESVGGYVAPGLPNITGNVANNIGETNTSATNSALYTKNQRAHAAWAGSTSVSRQNDIFIDASRSNSIYGNSDTVQPKATEMYLYFYVGNFEQSAIEQAAGITSEQLNQKADLDLGNITPEAKSAVVAMGMPDYSAGVYISNATIKAGFTAPSSGYLVSTAGWATLTINGNSLPNGAFTFANNTSSLQQIFIPLDSGDVVVGTGAYITDSSRFFPVKGVQ